MGGFYGEIVAKVGRWMAKFVRWIGQVWEIVTKVGRWIAKFVRWIG
jgi:hypothetical protein